MKPFVSTVARIYSCTASPLFPSLRMDSGAARSHRRGLSGVPGSSSKTSRRRSLRYWFPPEKKKTPDQPPGDFPLTVMSYNILADDLFKKQPELYTCCKRIDAKWTSRWPRILAEIRTLNPDVLALQEVQSDHYTATIYPDLKKLSYEGIYKKRTGITYSDGVALFYKHPRLKLLGSSGLEFNQNRLSLNRDNVALMATLETPGKQTFVMATTHLLFNPKRFNVRLAQSALLMAELRRLSSGGQSPVIVTGDFNSEPNSLVHQFWTTGRVVLKDETSFCLRSIGLTSNCVHEHTLEAGDETHSYGKSPYIVHRASSFHSPAGVPYNPYESPFEEMSHDFDFQSTEFYDTKGVTSKQMNGWCRVDYIFYAAPHKQNGGGGNLRLLQVLRSPMPKQLSGNALPNKAFPSDHISQAARFLLSS